MKAVTLIQPVASLVVQTSFLCDMVLTTPLLAHLAGEGPVDVVAIPSSAGLLANHPAVRELIAYDKRGADRGMGGLLRLARRLRAGRYGAAYLAQGSVRSGALVWLARIPKRVGFATSAGRRFYTAQLPNVDGPHHARKLLSLAMGDAARTAPDAVIRPRLYPGAAERAAVDALLAENGWRGEPLVAVAPGSVWGTKRWPFYPALARRLTDERQGRIVLAVAIAIGAARVLLLDVAAVGEE